MWINSKNLPGIYSCSKFEPRFRGTFDVVEKIGQVAYRLKLPPSYTCHDVFHVSLLSRHRPRDPAMNAPEAAVGWEPVKDKDGRATDHYKVDYILQQEGEGDAARYLVKWRGMPEERATWEPVQKLTNCKSVLRAFHKTLRARQRKVSTAPDQLESAAARAPSSAAKQATPSDSEFQGGAKT